MDVEKIQEKIEKEVLDVKIFKPTPTNNYKMINHTTSNIPIRASKPKEPFNKNQQKLNNYLFQPFIKMLDINMNKQSEKKY